MDNGVNITVDGGLRILNGSSFNYNFGNGVNMTFNETNIDNKTRYARLAICLKFVSTLNIKRVFLCFFSVSYIIII